MLAALLATPLVLRLARWMGIVDVPNARKVHASPTPRAGGLAIAAALFAVLVPGFLWAQGGNGFGRLEGQMIALLASASGLLLVGLLDDIMEISSKFKLLALLAASAAFCGAGGTIDQILIRGKEPIELGMLAWPVTMLWMTGVCVAINFIDGLDGLAAGIAAIACGVIAIASIAMGGHPAISVLALALLGSLSGFLFFNFNPARVFMGDCGSLFIGFLIAGAAVLNAQWIGTVRGLLLPALALSVPLLDTFFTLVRRGVLYRQSLFSAERGHIHHRLLDLGLGQKHAVLLLYGVSVAAAVIGLVARIGEGWATLGGVALLIPLLGGLFRMSGSVRASETIRAIRKNRHLARETRRNQLAFDGMQLRFRRVSSFDAWWEQVCATAEELGFTRINLPVVDRDGTKRVLRWSRGELELEMPETLRANLPLAQRRGDQPLRAEVEILAQPFLESAGQRLALFTRLIEEYSIRDLPTHCTTESKSAGGNGHVFEFSTGAAPRAFPPNVRVAVVHDFLYTYAGAERVLEQILQVVPQADLFSLFDFLPEGERGFIHNKPVKTSFIQRMPRARQHHRMYLPLMPLAIEQLDVSDYDVVISSSYLAAKGVLTRPDQLHVCYCHSPVRFAWDMQHQYLGKSGLAWGIKSLLARWVLHYIRAWDIRSANGVDKFLTNSHFVSRRIEKVYRRGSTPVYPPVDVERFALCSEKLDFYVTASRMVPYKRMDLIVDAFARMPNRKLLVIGEGPDFERIAERARSAPNVKLLGKQSHERLRYYLQHAKAFVFAAEEDFGIVPVEAMACGTPVIAFGRGGVTESVVSGKTGLFFGEQTPESLIAAVEEFEQCQWDPAEIRASAERFSVARFHEEFARVVRQEYVRFRARLVDRLDATTLGLPEIHSPPVADATPASEDFPEDADLPAAT
jgi:UDP-N-acetylmuramyl pentapeptide phosphotransferase/UDP-N-acetylglucosamine-1-phosphate transferase/glycosyltransferase involved in cell wall biosynthesis